MGLLTFFFGRTTDPLPADLITIDERTESGVVRYTLTDPDTGTTRTDSLNAFTLRTKDEQREALNDDHPDYGKVDPATKDFVVPVYVVKSVAVKYYEPWDDATLQGQLLKLWQAFKDGAAAEAAAPVTAAHWDGKAWT